jgi:hypothetical protein
VLEGRSNLRENVSESHYWSLEKMKNVQLLAIYTLLRGYLSKVTNEASSNLYAKLLTTKPYSYELKAEF